jgi:hypothetical protein
MPLAQIRLPLPPALSHCGSLKPAAPKCPVFAAACLKACLGVFGWAADSKKAIAGLPIAFFWRAAILHSIFGARQRFFGMLRAHIKSTHLSAMLAAERRRRRLLPLWNLEKGKRQPIGGMAA